MPTLTVTHEAPLELIRQHPGLAIDLVQAMTSVQVPAGGRARLGPTDANSVVPAQFTADSVVVVDDPGTGRPSLVIVIEPQGRDDKTKSYAWPAYLANIREAVQCPRAILIVVCPDPREAERCRRAISMGHPGWDLWPIVIDPAHAPSDQGAGPYLLLFLACLPALDMESEEGAARVLNAIRETGASTAQRKRLAAIILERASHAAQRHLEELMKTSEYKNDFIESYVQVGLEQGIEKGIEQGIERGAVADAAEKLLKLLEGRGLNPTDVQRTKVAGSTDLAELNLWFDRAITAETAADVFGD
jgi:hypothetical protein